MSIETTHNAISRSRTVELRGAKQVAATLQMGAGTLTIGDGAANLLDATLTYPDPSWEPELTYQIAGEQGNLLLRQPDSPRRSAQNNHQHHWDLRFQDQVPLELRLNVGAGHATLTVGKLALTQLAIDAGAGTLTLDLTQVQQPLAINIKGGVVNATIHLPADLSTEATITAPIVTVHGTSLHRRGHTYRTAAGSDPAAITIAIKSGVASIDFSKEER